MAGDDFRKKIQIVRCRGSRNLIIRGQRNTFETSRQPAGLRPRCLFWLCYRRRAQRQVQNTWQAQYFCSKSLMAGDDIRKKFQIVRAHWSLHTWAAQYFGAFEACSSARAAGPFFGHVLFAQRNVSKP